jgi:hypothetical protein
LASISLTTPATSLSTAYTLYYTYIQRHLSKNA